MFIKKVLPTVLYHMTWMNNKKLLMVIFGKFNMAVHLKMAFLTNRLDISDVPYST